MPHPVGGAMGVTLRHCREKGNTLFETVTLYNLTLIFAWLLYFDRLLTFACLPRHPANCSTALPEVFSRDLQVCQFMRTLKLMLNLPGVHVGCINYLCNPHGLLAGLTSTYETYGLLWYMYT